MRNILLIILLVAVSGCGSRKKTVQQEKSEQNYSLEADSVSQTLLVSEEANITDSVASSAESNITIEYEGTLGDSITVAQYGPDGQVQSKTVIKGSGKVTLGNSSSKSDSRKISSGKETKVAKMEISTTKSESAQAFKESLDKHVERKGPGFWFWFWAAIIIIALLLLWCFRKKIKTLFTL